MSDPTQGRVAWRILKDCPPPTRERQQELVLECAAARTLYRVALLRVPEVPDPIVVQARAARIRFRSPVPLPRQVEIALALQRDDPDGRACDAAMDWLRDRPELAVFHAEAARARARWHTARSALVTANLRLGAATVRRRFFYSPMPQEDLMQEAVFGLARAADRFDPNYGVKFSTYATWWIRHSAQRAIHNTMRVVRLPAHVCDSLTRYAVALHELGDDADEQALARHTQLSLAKLRKVAHLYRTQGAGPVSLDAPVPGLDRDLPMLENVQGEDLDMDEEISQRERGEILRRMLRRLSPRERNILKQRFGLHAEEKTLAEIGRGMAISRERVRQIEKAALHQLAESADPTLGSTS